MCSEEGFVSTDVLSVSNYERGGEPWQWRASVELAARQIPLAVNKPIGGGTGKPDAIRLHGESDA